MADSNITKKALASALKSLMQEMPFEKINVAQICEKCDMNRKSFYYHFKDKYDLVNWIFDSEFIPLMMNEPEYGELEERFRFMLGPMTYFYENRGFYRKALQIKGQNSFSDHLREYMLPLLRNRTELIQAGLESDDFTLNFFADAALCAIERWLKDPECIPPEEFIVKMWKVIFYGSERAYQLLCRGDEKEQQ